MARLFSRGKDDTTADEEAQAEAPAMPPELSDYYQAERRERMWGTWILSFLALAVTITVLFAIFLGGRWAYRRYISKPDAVTPTIGVNENQPSQPSTPSTTRDNNNGSSTPAANGSGSGTSSSRTNNANGSTPVAGDSDLAQTGPSGDLPNTGPGSVVAVFAITSVLGTAAYSLVTRKSRS